MSATITLYDPTGMPRPLGLYRQVARSRAEEYLHIAGQLGVDGDGSLAGDGSFEAQMRRAFGNLDAALRSADAGFANVVKFTTYLTRSEDLPEFRRLRDELFAGYFTTDAYPPNTLLFVAGLAGPEYRIEVEAIAAI